MSRLSEFNARLQTAKGRDEMMATHQDEPLNSSYSESQTLYPRDTCLILNCQFPPT